MVGSPMAAFTNSAERLIARKSYIDYCTILEVDKDNTDGIKCHSPDNEKYFNTVSIKIRSTKKNNTDPKAIQHVNAIVLQTFTGNCFGEPYHPRVGDLVAVLFMYNEKPLVLGPVATTQQVPVMRGPTSRDALYDYVNKWCQWLRPEKDKNDDYYNHPPGKMPICFKRFHGPVTGEPGGCGRDEMTVWDCQKGDADPTCAECCSIDDVCRAGEQWNKIYSSQTESKEAYNSRMEQHARCGSYLRFESDNVNTAGTTSSEYSEGKGHIRFGNAIDENHKKGHINFKPTGTIDIHSNHENVAFASESTGSRISVVPDEDISVLFAFQAKYFEKNAYIEILKSGDIDIVSPTEITLEAPDITLDGDVQVTGNMEILGTCTHSACSCEGLAGAAMLAGQSGGQTLCGGTGVDEELTLCGTSDASKGTVNVDADLTCSGSLKCAGAAKLSSTLECGGSICGGQTAGTDLTICGSTNGTDSGQVIVASDLECSGDLGTQIKSSIKTYCDTLYTAHGAIHNTYNTIVYISGTSIIAEKNDGTNIDTGILGTDDSKVINSAIASCPDNGNLYIDFGTYTLTADTIFYLDGGTSNPYWVCLPILDGKNIHIFGAGIDSTILKLADSQHDTNHPVVMILSRATNLTDPGFTSFSISDMTLDGNKANQTAWYYDGAGLILTGSTRSGGHYYNLKLKDSHNTGIYLGNNGSGIEYNSFLHNIYVENPYAEGIFLDSCQQITLSDCICIGDNTNGKSGYQTGLYVNGNSDYQTRSKDHILINNVNCIGSSVKFWCINDCVASNIIMDTVDCAAERGCLIHSSIGLYINNSIFRSNRTTASSYGGATYVDSNSYGNTDGPTDAYFNNCKFDGYYGFHILGAATSTIQNSVIKSADTCIYSKDITETTTAITDVINSKFIPTSVLVNVYTGATVNLFNCINSVPGTGTIIEDGTVNLYGCEGYNFDETRYAVLTGKSGGQTLRGGTGSSENLILESTSNATKGIICIGPGNGKMYIGETPYDNTNNLAGWGFQRYSDGSLYSSWKTISGGSINLRCGSGKESGSARTFLTITPSTGACYFLDEVSAATFTDRTPAFTGDALSEIRKMSISVTNKIDHESLPEFIRYGENKRNLGNSVSLLLSAVKQLIDYADSLKSELEKEKSKETITILDSEPHTGNKPQFFMTNNILKLKLPNGDIKTVTIT